MILLKVEKDMKNHPFFNEKASQYSSGHAECSFDNPCRIALPRVEKILPEVQTFKKKLEKNFVSNCFHGDGGCGFKNLVVNF